MMSERELEEYRYRVQVLPYLFFRREVFYKLQSVILLAFTHVAAPMIVVGVLYVEGAIDRGLWYSLLIYSAALLAFISTVSILISLARLYVFHRKRKALILKAEIRSEQWQQN